MLLCQAAFVAKSQRGGHLQLTMCTHTNNPLASTVFTFFTMSIAPETFEAAAGSKCNSYNSTLQTNHTNSTQPNAIHENHATQRN